MVWIPGSLLVHLDAHSQRGYHAVLRCPWLSPLQRVMVTDRIAATADIADAGYRTSLHCGVWSACLVGTLHATTE